MGRLSLPANANFGRTLCDEDKRLRLEDAKHQRVRLAPIDAGPILDQELKDPWQQLHWDAFKEAKVRATVAGRGVDLGHYLRKATAILGHAWVIDELDVRALAVVFWRFARSILHLDVARVVGLGERIQARVVVQSLEEHIRSFTRDVVSLQIEARERLVHLECRCK